MKKNTVKKKIKGLEYIQGIERAYIAKFADQPTYYSPGYMAEFVERFKEDRRKGKLK